MRGLIWSLLLGVEKESEKNAGVYEVTVLIFSILVSRDLCVCLLIRDAQVVSV